MNRLFFLASAAAGGVVWLMLFCGSPACSGGEAQQPGPEHQAAALQQASSEGELQGFPLLLRLYFKALPAKMPGSQDDTPQLVELGRRLYFERGLSQNKTQSCNDCHRLDGGRAGVDNLPTSKGDNGGLGQRNSPTVLNAGFQPVQFWDGRAPDLVEQAKGPVLNPIEMGMHSPADVVNRLQGLAGYRREFAAAFPGQAEPLTYDNVARAIAAFERTLVTPARFDRYLQGEQAALTREELHGLHRFADTGCMDCHNSHLVGGRLFQKLGVYQPYRNQQDAGRREVTHNEADRMVFKVPSLRNVTRTAPYFHDGQVADLPEAVRLMAGLQLDVVLDQAAIDEIVTFLQTLEAERPLVIPIQKMSLADDLKSQYNEEAQVAAQYAAFAGQARTEGLPQAARLFDALVAAENMHAEWLLRLGNGVRSTADNLKAGHDYESYLAGKVLPAIAALAAREGDGKAQTVLENLDAACVRHETVLRKAREQVLSGHDLPAQPIWICPACGTVLVGVAPDTCPVCDTPKAKYVRVP